MAYLSSSWKGTGLRAGGDGILSVSKIKPYEGDNHVTDPLGVRFEISADISEVEEGVLEYFTTLKEITFEGSPKRLGVSEKARRLLQKNDVLIRGKFGSYAEHFAKEYGLRFVHSDIKIGRSGNYFENHGSDVITLMFEPDEKPRICQSNFCQGISAGSSGGGDVYLYLPKDFYLTYSNKDIADICWGTCYDSILKNSELGAFLAKAKKKGGYYIVPKKDKEKSDKEKQEKENKDKEKKDKENK